MSQTLRASWPGFARHILLSHIVSLLRFADCNRPRGKTHGVPTARQGAGGSSKGTRTAAGTLLPLKATTPDVDPTSSLVSGYSQMEVMSELSADAARDVACWGMPGLAKQLNVTFIPENRLIAFTKDVDTIQAFLEWLRVHGWLVDSRVPDDEYTWTCGASCSVEQARGWFSQS